ncbi:MAG TPA: MliC family protein [Bauldia sp.]|nr:MliC family protein [Bauldia sp.]
MRVVPVVPLLIVGAWAANGHAADLTARASFTCNLGKTIEAHFYSDFVQLQLSDGRSMRLPQALSGSGARYATADESIVFWNKGNTAFITEGDPAVDTYSGCIVVSDMVPDPDWLAFASSELGFSLRYPPGYAVDGGYVFDGFGPGRDIAGVAFTIPEAMTTGTNLAADTRLSVETMPNAPACVATAFIPGPAENVRILTENNTDYSVAESSEAGAGNVFDTTVYALLGTSPCLAVRYFVHSANIDNFDPGTVTQFDRNALIAEFDAIRKTLVVGQ